MTSCLTSNFDFVNIASPCSNYKVILIYSYNYYVYDLLVVLLIYDL